MQYTHFIIQKEDFFGLFFFQMTQKNDDEHGETL